MKAANVDHILKAVGRMHIPRTINRRRLREDIEWAGSLWDTLNELDSRGLWSGRVHRLKDIEMAARRLRSLLSNDTAWLQQVIGQQFPLGEGAMRGKRRDPAPSLRGLVVGLARLARITNRARGQTKPEAPLRQDKSAAEWLIGTHLPEIFEQHFQQQARIARPRSHHGEKEITGKANSPYIRFAEAVLNELGIKSTHGGPYSRETILKVFQQTRSGAKPRRKPSSEEGAACLP
ncbi:hypothetical protein DC522_01560 [Microvirga sp. KLBC 81]|nr:hypothetical protein DC522_01560 [Microvirga sp. KLBC 81]